MFSYYKPIYFYFRVLCHIEFRETVSYHLHVKVSHYAYFNPFIKMNGHPLWYRNIYFSNTTFLCLFTLVTVSYIWTINFDLYSSHTKPILIWLNIFDALHFWMLQLPTEEQNYFSFFLFPRELHVCKNNHILFPYRFKAQF